jgi:hypothetical protein
MHKLRTHPAVWRAREVCDAFRAQAWRLFCFAAFVAGMCADLLNHQHL